MLNKQLEI